MPSRSRSPIWPSPFPSAVTTTRAGWAYTPNRAHSSPRSAILGNEPIPNWATPRSRASDCPRPPTPTTLTPWIFDASTTVGASLLHTGQRGAQNQNRVSRPARSAPRIVPPPTSGASKSNSTGTTAAELVVVVGGAVAAGDVVAIVRLVVVVVVVVVVVAGAGAGAGRVVAWPPPQPAAITITTPTRRPAVGSRCMPPRYDRYRRIW